MLSWTMSPCRMLTAWPPPLLSAAWGACLWDSGFSLDRSSAVTDLNSRRCSCHALQAASGLPQLPGRQLAGCLLGRSLQRQQTQHCLDIWAQVGSFGAVVAAAALAVVPGIAAAASASGRPAYTQRTLRDPLGAEGCSWGPPQPAPMLLREGFHGVNAWPMHGNAAHCIRPEGATPYDFKAACLHQRALWQACVSAADAWSAVPRKVADRPTAHALHTANRLVPGEQRLHPLRLYNMQCT